MATILTIAINHSTTDSEYGTTGVDWVDLELANDYLIFSGGSNVVKDGEPVPSQSDLNQAGVVLDGTEQVIDLYLLADNSASELKEVFMMGNQDKRYVMAFDFDGETASEPILELWDNSSMNSINNISLGAGVPTSSWWKGVVTTDGLPGADWTGTRLAGSTNGHFLWLNNQAGALLSAKTLYCNLKIVIPASALTAGAETPVLVVKYTSN